MFGHVAENDLRSYEMTEALEPVLWSYAEDLEQYLPFSSWLALKPFKNVWGSSAFKGADGPMRYNSNPMHYIKNHESWVVQMARAYREFDYFQVC
uniref:Uncharacterized protein n=1 Tax=Panagrolaimus sp. ES5 TaxID=591445 RepID=A0AC34GH49_9BILA